MSKHLPDARDNLKIRLYFVGNDKIDFVGLDTSAQTTVHVHQDNSFSPIILSMAMSPPPFSTVTKHTRNWSPNKRCSSSLLYPLNQWKREITWSSQRAVTIASKRRVTHSFPFSTSNHDDGNKHFRIPVLDFCPEAFGRCQNRSPHREPLTQIFERSDAEFMIVVIPPVRGDRLRGIP